MRFHHPVPSKGPHCCDAIIQRPKHKLLKDQHWPQWLALDIIHSIWKWNDGALLLVHSVPNELEKKEKKKKKKTTEDFNIDGNDWLCEFHWSRLAFGIESYDALGKKKKKKQYGVYYSRI